MNIIAQMRRVVDGAGNHGNAGTVCHQPIDNFSQGHCPRIKSFIDCLGQFPGLIDCMLNTDRLVGQSLDTFTVRIEFFLNNQIFKVICIHNDGSPAWELYFWNAGAQKSWLRQLSFR